VHPMYVSAKPGASRPRSPRAGLDAERHEDVRPVQAWTHRHAGDGRSAGVG
jgi:hypothetical protein